MADGFLGRWSRRKQDALAGKPLQEPPAPVVVPVPAMPAALAQGAAPTQAPEPALPTLEQAQTLTAQSDFSPFVARGVAPEVRNAAMKKLFADPHFNVMDGLDIYIDDYSRPDPLPLAMLRQMASAQFLGMVQDEPDPEEGAAAQSEPPKDPSVPCAAQASSLPPPTAVAQSQPLTTPNHHHAHADLRLQPDHAPSAPSAGRGAP